MASSADRLGTFQVFYNEKQLGVSVRGELGRWITPSERNLFSKHRKIAENMQADVVSRIEGGLKRPGVSTGRLLRVTADRKNVFYAHTGLGLGNSAFLDKGIAKYWRTIEEGSQATWHKRSFQSLELQGFWGLTLGEWRSGPSGPWVRYAATNTGRPAQPATGGGGKYSPFRGINLPVFHPKHDIQPMHAYLEAGRKANLREVGFADARQYIQETLGRVLHDEAAHTELVTPLGPRFDPYHA